MRRTLLLTLLIASNAFAAQSCEKIVVDDVLLPKLAERLSQCGPLKFVVVGDARERRFSAAIRMEDPESAVKMFKAMKDLAVSRQADVVTIRLKKSSLRTWGA